MKALQPLEKAGLVVHGPSVSGTINIYKLEPESDVSALLRCKGNKWVFLVSETLGGIGPEDLRCEFDSLNAAVEFTLFFYFGEPTIIDGWVIPLHRHPEIPFENLDQVLKNATRLNQAEFHEHEEKHFQEMIDFQRRHQNRGLWEFVLQHQYIKIPNVTDPAISLRLRRDGQEAYIVVEY